MGNSGSQAQAQATLSIQHWTTQSYPRPTQQRALLSSRRVLPDVRVAPPTRLRPTDNGEILYNGGTISGRQINHHQQQQRASSAEASSTDVQNDADKSGTLVRYGSAPDLRVDRTTVITTAAAIRPTNGGCRNGGRKKYRAPQPPAQHASALHHNRGDTSQDSWEVTSNGDTSDEPMRRARLFKTRAEMRRRPPNGRSAPAISSNTTVVAVPITTLEPRSNGATKPLSELNRSRSLPEFQAELQAATNRLRSRRDREQDVKVPVSARPRPAPANTFYFGMDHQRCEPVVSDDDDEYEASVDNIALNLRPILPKKQLEVPRFSPAAAWRQLGPFATSSPMAECLRTSNVPVVFHAIPQRNQVESWTPEQDLEGEDDTTSDEEANGDGGAVAGKSVMAAKFSARSSHVFSLSLPRENQLAAYMEDKSWRAAKQIQQQNQQNQQQQQYQQQQQQTPTTATTRETSDNWFLSRSAPNSLGNIGHASLEHESGRLMYLPGVTVAAATPPVSTTRSKARETITAPSIVAATRPQDLQDPPPSPPPPATRQSQADPTTRAEERRRTTGGKAGRRFTFQSTVRQIERRRLAERLSREAERKERQRLGELAAMQRVEEEFQRKRAREKASIRHQLRLYSMDTTAQQVTSLQDEAPTSPPAAPSITSSSSSSMMGAPPLARRADPDGSDSPAAVDSPRATQVLSEYRLPRREYKEWQTMTTAAAASVGAGGATNNRDAAALVAGTAVTPATVHPKVVCDMPRASSALHHRHGHASNYRRNFAHRVRPHAKCTS